MSELLTLRELAGGLVEVVSGGPHADRAERLRSRLAQGRFTIAVVGEFKRGKSTLVNALLGEPVVPMGVLPLTAVATELCDGEPGVRVVHLDGDETPAAPDELAVYVTEAANPGNVRRVDHVVVSGRWPLLAGGVTLQDTPGIGSVHAHNTAAARAAIVDADGAILVLSADTPISDDERAVLRVLAERRAPTFFALNKADHLDRAELDQVLAFVGDVLRAELGRDEPVYAVSAKAALAAAVTGRPVDGVGGVGGAGDWPAFAAAVRRFVDDDLVGARAAGARRDLHVLAGDAAASLRLEAAAAELEAAELSERVGLFETEAARQSHSFDDDCVLLERDVQHLSGQLWTRLQAFADSEPQRHAAAIEAVAASAPRRELTAAMRAAVEVAVETSFERFRNEQQAELDRSWQELAARLRDAAQARVDGVRAAAASLFDIPLPAAGVPTVSAERERFFYLFLHLDRIQPVTTAITRLVPERIQRRRAAERAHEELRAELDKYAGRARSDLVTRLDATCRRFETAMQVELDTTITAILEAARRAERLRASNDIERAARLAEIDGQLVALAAIDEAVDRAGRADEVEGGRR